VEQEKKGLKLSVLFYSASNRGAGERLNTVVKAFVHKEEIEDFRTMHKFSQRLREPKHDLDIAIVVADSKEELEKLVAISDLLSDIRVILVLPDKAEKTIGKGHALRPRFLSYVDSNFLDVAAVLSKMLANGHSDESFTKKDHGPGSPGSEEGAMSKRRSLREKS